MPGSLYDRLLATYGNRGVSPDIEDRRNATLPPVALAAMAQSQDIMRQIWISNLTDKLKTARGGVRSNLARILRQLNGGVSPYDIPELDVIMKDHMVVGGLGGRQ